MNALDVLMCRVRSATKTVNLRQPQHTFSFHTHIHTRMRLCDGVPRSRTHPTRSPRVASAKIHAEELPYRLACGIYPHICVRTHDITHCGALTQNSVYATLPSQSIMPTRLCAPCAGCVRQSRPPLSFALRVMRSQ